MKGNSPCTQQTLADHLGISRSTVSLALRNHRSIPEATKQLVLTAAKELDYKPNPLISALMTHLRKGDSDRQSNHIALLQAPHDAACDQLTYKKWIKGARDRAAELGYIISDFELSSSVKTGRQLERVLRARGIEGLVVVPPMFPLLKNSFPWANFASAAIQMLDQPRLHCSASHHLRIMADCISELRSLGYQRIGLYLEQETDALMYHAWSGYLLAYQRTVALGHRVDPLLVKTWEPKKFGAWLRSSKPDVVLTIHLEALGWIHQAGYDVPGDIAFVHLDHHAEFGDCAGMDQQHPLVGAAAVDLVSAQLNRNERGIPLNAKILSVVGRWVNGRTVRPLS